MEQNEKLTEEKRKDKLATILTLIIQNSTILPFRWHMSKYNCFYCQSVFVQSSELRDHAETKHRQVEIEEIIIRTLSKARRTKLDISNIWCTTCADQFDTFHEYLEHLSKRHALSIDKDATQFFDCFHLADDGMSCLECGQYFRFFGPLLLHTYKYHVEKIVCDICGQGFHTKHNVLNHINHFHGIKSCKHCNEVFPTQYALRNHVENVHRTDKLQCPMCPEILINRYLKKRHMALVHDCKSVQLVCEFCSKIFTRNNKYIQHKLRVHNKEKNCTCDVCGHKTFSPDCLKRHMVVHTEERPFKCEMCGLTFRRNKNLADHLKRHTTTEWETQHFDRIVLEVSQASE